MSRLFHFRWLELLERPEQAKLSGSSSRKRARLGLNTSSAIPSAPLHSVQKGWANQGSATELTSISADAALPTMQPYSQGLGIASISHQSHPQALPEQQHLLNSRSIYAIPQPSADSGQMIPTRARKRKMSSAEQCPILEPGLLSIDVPVASWLSDRQIAATSSSRLPTPMHAAPLPGYSDSVSVSSFPSSVNLNASAPHDQQQTEFTNLTSSFMPADDLAHRNSGNLAYYALAAGQQRGGYLAYQPIWQQAYPAVWNRADPDQQQPLFTPATQRPLARFTRQMNLSRAVPPGRGHQAHGNARVSLSLSPADVRALRQPGHKQLMSTSSPNFCPPPSSLSACAIPTCRTAYSPSSDFGPTGLEHRSLPPHRGRVLPSFTPASLALPSSSSISSMTPAQAPLHNGPAQAIHHLPLSYPTTTHMSYSSFSNNGLPGVLHWPVPGTGSHPSMHGLDRSCYGVETWA